MEKLSNINLNENDNDEVLTTYIKFVDVDKYNTDTNKQVEDSIRITGKLGQTIALALAIPKNYCPAGNYKVPTRFTFRKNHRNAIVVPLEHKKATENLTLIGKRTISYKIAEKDGKVRVLSDGTQNLKFEAIKITDLLTGKVYYDWKNKDDQYDSVTSLIEEGYYASQQQTAGKKISIDELINNEDEFNEKVSVLYRPLGSIIQQDMEGNELGRVKYLNSDDPTKAAPMPLPLAPAGYGAISKLPDKIIPIDPGVDTVLTYREIQSKTYVHKVTRMITLMYWDGTKKTYSQEVGYVFEDNEWKLAPGTKKKWKIVTPDIVEGYSITSVKLASGRDYEHVVRRTDGKIFAIDGVKPKFDTPSEDITVFIKPDLQKTYISLINTDSPSREELKRVDFVGRTDETVPLSITDLDLPEGYEIVNKESVPKQYSFKSKYNSPILVSVKKKQESKSIKIKLY